MEDQKPQINKFQEASSTLYCDDKDNQFKDNLKNLAKHKPVDRSQMIVTFYLSVRQGSLPKFQDRRELDELPRVGGFIDIAGNKYGEAVSVVVLANSESNPELAGLLHEQGAWVVCQETS